MSRRQVTEQELAAAQAMYRASWEWLRPGKELPGEHEDPICFDHYIGLARAAFAAHTCQDPA